jgi:amino acid transporter
VNRSVISVANAGFGFVPHALRNAIPRALSTCTIRIQGTHERNATQDTRPPHDTRPRHEATHATKPHTPPNGRAPLNQPIVDADTERLHELGYAQELHRGMGTFSNFAISFSIISILAGALTSFSLGMFAGGPRIIILGWIIVGVGALAVGASMGEICSAYPTAGGLYYWSAKLATKNGPRWAWFTGWFNLVGQIGVIASVDWALANYVIYCANLFGWDSIKVANKWHVYIMYLLLLVIHGLLNTFNVRLVKKLGDVSVWWHVIGVVVIVLALLAAGKNKTGTTGIFAFKNATGWSFPGSGLYVGLIGLLLAQYTITGFDASAHVSEETTSAATSAPKAIVRSIYISAIAALLMNFVMLLAIPKGKYDEIASHGILAGAYVFTTSLVGTLGKLLVVIATVGQFFCGMASVTANSRMIYAFSRDRGLPGSSLWHRINPKTRTPTNSIWLGIVLSAFAGALTLLQTKKAIPVAFYALTLMCVIGLYISYIIPVYLRLRNPDFKTGPWNLGSRSKLVGWFSVAYVAAICLIGILPQFVPWNKWESANLTLPVIGGIAILVGLWWNFSAKKWFTGPKVQGSKEELLAIEKELSSFV